MLSLQQDLMTFCMRPPLLGLLYFSLKINLQKAGYNSVPYLSVLFDPCCPLECYHGEFFTPLCFLPWPEVFLKHLHLNSQKI